MAAVIRAILTSPSHKNTFRLLTSNFRNFSTQNKEKNEDEVDLDKPIKYSTSPAAGWKAESSFTGREDPDITPWYQPLVVSLSVTIFMLYFCVFREENDIDRIFDTSLYDRVEGLEEIQIQNVIKYYKETDPSYNTKALEKRLAELQALKIAEKPSLQ